MIAECAKTIAEILVQLKYSAEKPETGICTHVDDCIVYETAGDDDSYMVLIRVWNEYSEQFFESWPEFSGNTVYPVPSPIAEYPSATYAHLRAYVTMDRWTGEYGMSRMRLLDHLIEQFIKLAGSV